MIGKRFTRLVVISEAPRSSHGAQRWFCRCDCGCECIVTRQDLRRRDSRAVKSCGCLQRETAGRRRRTHGKSGTRVHLIWKNLKKRCLNPKDSHYALYGGRGITVCERWMDFANFYADMGDPPAGMSLDRRDNDGNYEPGNCRWATPRIQRRNSPTCKLTLELAKEILQQPTVPGRALAAKYGVGQTTISLIRSGKNWPDAYEAIHGRHP